MRGKVVYSELCMYNRRITPAHAGKSLRDIQWRICRRDHPRTCGEKLLWHGLFFRLGGSPPHMRGKVKSFNSYNLPYGITPAHAGKSLLYNLMKLYGKDHPRTCGEKVF